MDYHSLKLSRNFRTMYKTLFLHQIIYNCCAFSVNSNIVIYNTVADKGRSSISFMNIIITIINTAMCHYL